MTDQLPPADELFAVRAEVKRLTDRERVLRSLMLADPEARTGNLYCAEIKTVTTQRTDIKELRAMHKDLVEEYTHPQKTVRIELRGITEDGEITRIKLVRHEAV